MSESPRDAAPEVAPQGIASLLDRLHRDKGDPEDPEWNVVARKRVLPDRWTVVQGSHYTLTFPPGAVSATVEITIRERDPLVIDVELGPDGTRFHAPVKLEIDYRGTTADVFSRHWDGTLPVLYLLDESTGLWQLLGGVNNALARRYTIDLEHFSRYAFRPPQGTAGWN